MRSVPQTNQMDVRVLLLSYYFPPAAGPGVQRVLKFAKYLPSFGVEPIVLTLDPQFAAYPGSDHSLASDLPADIEVIRTRSVDPFGAYGRLTGQSRSNSIKVGSLGTDRGWRERVSQFVRANFVLPDARVGWVPFAYRAARSVLERKRSEGHPIDVVMTSGPPHSTHLAGRALKARAACPWLADFRDPWTDIGYYESLPMLPPARAFDRWLERGVLRNADVVTTVSPYWASLLADRSGISRHVEVVQNGYDQEDFQHVDAGSDGEGLFTLTHVGSLYEDRNPTALWKAIVNLKGRGLVSRLRLRLVGGSSEMSRNMLRTYGLEDIAEVVPYAPHDDAIRYMQHAQLLLLTIESFGADRGMITGKMYEYLASGRPILGIGPADGDAAKLLHEASAGSMLGRDDVDGIAAFLLDQYQSWSRGRTTEGAKSAEVGALTRENQSRILAGHLREIAGKT
ncbi:glycosyltransferase [soil metagenome]